MILTYDLVSRIILSGASGFYTKVNFWGSLGLNFDYDGGPIIEIGGSHLFIYGPSVKGFEQALAVRCRKS